MAFGQTCFSVNRSKHKYGFLNVRDVTLCETRPHVPPQSATGGSQRHIHIGPLLKTVWTVNPNDWIWQVIWFESGSPAVVASEQLSCSILVVTSNWAFSITNWQVLVHRGKRLKEVRRSISGSGSLALRSSNRYLLLRLLFRLVICSQISISPPSTVALPVYYCFHTVRRAKMNRLGDSTQGRGCRAAQKSTQSYYFKNWICEEMQCRQGGIGCLLD